MKKILFATILLAGGLHAVQINPPQTGTAAAASAKTASDSSWQNWTFAGAMIVTAAAGIFATSVASGASANGH